MELSHTGGIQVLKEKRFGLGCDMFKVRSFRLKTEDW